MAPTSISVVEAFRRRVAASPGAAAVVAGDERIDYARLDGWSDALAARLAGHGVRRGDRVAVCLERSPRLIAALLAVLKAGAAYVPVDAEDPDRRIADALGDAEVSAVLCDPYGTDRFAGSGVPVLPVGSEDARAGAYPGSDPGLPAVHAQDLAYLMYTSGSTGKPKAVMVEHRNIVNLVRNPNYVDLGPGDRILQLAPVAFDAATFEIWGALLNGARLVLAPPGQVDAEDLGALLRGYGVNVLWLTAALFHRQIDTDVTAFQTVGTVLAGGDVLSVAHIEALRAAVPGCRVVNGYGPTETTTFAACHRIGAEERLGTSVPIGRAIQNVRLRVVDEHGAEVSDGTPGELWIGGAGVARGYWRRPELTEAAFTTAVFDGEAGRYYRSGDRVVRRDGVLVFLGREDGQFKLRGMRVEPGEVENALTAHPRIATAAVAIRASHLGDRRLIAWVVPTGQDVVDRRALREHLRATLPEHMIPAGFVTLDALPITPNGKTDRAALPEPDWRSRTLYV